MESKWIIWTFVPTLTWAGWIHAGIRANHTKYFLIAALYGIPFSLAMIFHEDSTNGDYSTTYNAVMSLNILVWIGGIIHAQAAKKEVDLRIKYAGQSAASTTVSTDSELEKRIATEYGVQQLATNARTTETTVQSEVSMVSTKEEMSFEQWYTTKFEWFVTQPMPWKIVFQVILWLFYGFVWIPIWFVISDKQRGDAAQSNLDPTIQQRAQQPAHQQPTVQQTKDAVQTPPVPPPSPATPEASGVDVNNASEQELANLPGIGPILAKKTIKVRRSQGGFQSVDHFAQQLGLKPHVVEQIRSRVVVGTYTAPVTDSARKSSGRVVDF